MTLTRFPLVRLLVSAVVFLDLVSNAMAADQEQLWQVTAGLDGPESAYYDAES